MFDIKEEKGYKVIAECLRMGKLHYDELFKDRQDKIPMNYNWDFMKVCIDNGLVHTITARDEDGELIGYFIGMVGPDMFTSTFVAKELATFVLDEYRQKGVFHSLLRKAEELLINNGVSSLMLAFKEGHNSELPKKYGYTISEYVYEKVLGE